MSYRGLDPVKLITNGVMTGTDVLTSSIIDGLHMKNIGIHGIWTGTPTGTLVIDYSIDGVTYFSGAAIADPAGSASDAAASIVDFAYRYIRVKYTNASGTGVLNVWAVAKGP